MAAFGRLQDLGPERFQLILNALMRGKPAMALARQIQQEWGAFQDVQEKTLTQQLNRLRLAAATGAFGPKVAEKIAEGAQPQIPMLQGVSLSALVRMEELADIQRERMLELVKKEKLNLVFVQGKKMVMPLQTMGDVFNNYKDVLKDIQKMRFDLGLDEFKGQTTGLRGTSASLTLPDGTMLQKQVIEAVGAMEEVFNRRQIPKVVQMPPHQ